MSLTDHLEKIIKPLLPFIEETICDEKTIYDVKRFTVKNMVKTIAMLNQQKMPEANTEHSIYKLNIYDGKPEFHVDITTDEEFNSFQMDDTVIIMNILSTMSIMNFILDNQNNNYTFLPIYFWSNAVEHGHQTMFVIDNKKSKIYLFDPNGKSTFFNDILLRKICGIDKKEKNFNFEKIDISLKNEYYIDVSKYVDLLLQEYIRNINRDFGSVYEYIPSSLWNPHRHVINRIELNKSLIGTGHCVVASVLFVHYLVITNETSDSKISADFSSTYYKLGSLTNDELIYLINGYLGFFRTFLYQKNISKVYL
jgi:hypothetical protein